MKTSVILWILAWLLGLTVLGVFVQGCGPDYSGRYTGMQKFTGDDQVLANSIGKIELELKPTGRFVLRRLTVPWEGRWHTSGSKVVLDIDSAMGRDAAASHLELAFEGEGIRFRDGQGQTPELIAAGVLLTKEK